MQEPNLFAIYTDILNFNKIEYFISGSVASIVYGDPRLTNDIDLIISLNQNSVDQFISAFSSDKFYCPPKDTILNEIKRTSRDHFNLIHHETGFKADIYFAGKEKLQLWALGNKVQIEFLGGIIYVAPIEYVILKKLEFYQEGNIQKHILDIRSMLINSKHLINFEFLNENIKNLGLNMSWELIEHDAN